MVNVMNRKFTLLWTALLLLVFSGAWAQDDGTDGDADATIRLMGAAEAELPDAVTKEIILPEDADDEAALNAAEGLMKADERHALRENGLTIADEALENAADMAGEASDNIENRGRAEDLPVDVPGRPDVPDVPTPPTG